MLTRPCQDPGRAVCIQAYRSGSTNFHSSAAIRTKGFAVERPDRNKAIILAALRSALTCSVSSVRIATQRYPSLHPDRNAPIPRQLLRSDSPTSQSFSASTCCPYLRFATRAEVNYARSKTLQRPENLIYNASKKSGFHVRLCPLSNYWITLDDWPVCGVNGSILHTIKTE